MVEIKCNDFEDGGTLPPQFSAKKGNVCPSFIINNIPEKTKTIAITLDDMDHPLVPNYNHWIIWNIPVMNSTPSFTKGFIPKEEPLARQGLAYGRHKYKGPNPFFNQEHRYIFTFYFLDKELELDKKTHKIEFIVNIKGHLIDKATYTCKYKRI